MVSAFCILNDFKPHFTYKFSDANQIRWINNFALVWILFILVITAQVTHNATDGNIWPVEKCVTMCCIAIELQQNKTSIEFE